MWTRGAHGFITVPSWRTWHPSQLVRRWTKTSTWHHANHVMLCKWVSQPRSPPISPDLPRCSENFSIPLTSDSGRLVVSQSFILGCNDNMQMSCLHPDSPNRHLTARPAFQFTFNGRNSSVSSIRGQILIPIDGPSSIQQSSFSINHNLFGGKAPLMTSSYLMTSWSHHGKGDSILCQCGRPLAWRHGRIFFRTMERRQRWIFNWFSADSRVDL